MSFNDFKETLRDYVIAGTTVSTLIDTRFYGSHLATFYTTNTSFPLATYTVEPGKETLVHQNFSMIVKAYSNLHFDEAHDIYDAVYEMLYQHIPGARIVIHVEGSPSEMYEEASRLYSVTGRFKVTRLLGHD